MKRRTFLELAGLAGLAALTGCVGKRLQDEIVPVVTPASTPIPTIAQTSEIRETPIDELFVPINTLINRPEQYDGKIISTKAFVDLSFDTSYHEVPEIRRLVLDLYGNNKRIRPSIEAQNNINQPIKDIDIIEVYLPEYELKGKIELAASDFYFFNVSDFSEDPSKLRGRHVESSEVVGFPSVYEKDKKTIVMKGNILPKTLRDYMPTRRFPFYSETDLQVAEKAFNIFKPSEDIREDLLKANYPNYILSLFSPARVPPVGEKLWFEGKVEKERNEYCFFKILSGQKI